MKKIYQFIPALFFIIILAVPVYWLLHLGTPPEESVVEARTLIALGPSTAPNLQRALDLIKQGEILHGAKIMLDLYTSASFISKFERATSDQLPFRMPVIQFSKALDRGIINFTYGFVNDPVIPADMTTGIYFDSVNNQLLQPVTLFNANAREIIDNRINNYRDIIQAHPEQNFYLYYHQTIHNSAYHPMNQYLPEADKGQSIVYFESNKPEGLTLNKFLLTSMNDHLHYYYHTDHHWNVYGILRAYDEIYDMLSQNYPEISPMLENKEIVLFPGVNFLGYMARLTFYPIEGDEFRVEVIDIPSHEMKMSGQVVTIDTKQFYFNGDYSQIPYTNHFNEFYGNVTDLIEYSFDNNSDRNLLIIGSSFRNALDPLLASHYKKTYCIDLRYYTDFSLGIFLDKYKVDDILVIGDNVVAFEDSEYWTINP